MYLPSSNSRIRHESILDPYCTRPELLPTPAACYRLCALQSLSKYLQSPQTGMLRAILRSPVTHNAFRHSGLRQTSIRTFRKMESQSPQGVSGPLVWIDCEMTGLNPKKDRLLEIAVRSSSNRRLSSLTSTQVLITNGELELVDEGICYVIRTEKGVLDQYVTI